MGFEVSLQRLGWTNEREQQLRALADPELVAARVGVEHRGWFGLLGAGVAVAQLAGRLRSAGGQRIWPAVGDWVAVQPVGDRGIIQEVFPRTSVLSRRRPGTDEEQVVAANVDLVLVVTSVGRDLNPRRVERYLAAVLASGARPLLVLNKADLAPDPTAWHERLRSAAAGVPCLSTSAATGAGMAELRAQMGAGCTAVLVGSSGVGKSSLLNHLLGEDRLATRTVRLTDEKGRHTTTRRELVELPGGGCLIDTPGMREFGLSEAAADVERVFTDVEELASRCRFRDCQHGAEPGCAVRAAVADGLLPGDRVASFEKLRREEAFVARQRDPQIQDRNKRRWKSIHKGMRARRKVDPKLRED